MTELVPFSSGAGRQVEVFDPTKAKVRILKADAVMEYAAAIKDWPLLERAVTEKVEQQGEFVDWWHETVRGDGNPTGAGRGRLPRAQAEEQTQITHQQVSRWAKRLTNPEQYIAHLIAVEYKAAMGVVHNHLAQGTGENEWYTPSAYIELARRAMGEIDLDPASSDTAQSVVRATTYYTAKDNGLAQPWHGRVWLNPPYSQPLIQQFTEKLVAEVRAGNVLEAVMLTHNSTDTAWWHLAANASSAICFTRGRIAFIDPQGERCAPTQGQTFFYFGNRAKVFAHCFANVGFVR